MSCPLKPHPQQLLCERTHTHIHSSSFADCSLFATIIILFEPRHFWLPPHLVHAKPLAASQQLHSHIVTTTVVGAWARMTALPIHPDLVVRSSCSAFMFGRLAREPRTSRNIICVLRYEYQYMKTRIFTRSDLRSI